MTKPIQKGSKTGQPLIFGLANDQCVWSRAGVVKPIACINAFDCLGCAFDRKVQAEFEAKTAAPAPRDPRPVRLRMLINQRKCRHMLSGRVAYKLCGHSYDCVRCPYDQMLEDSTVLSPLGAPLYDHTSGFSVARDYYYHPGHTWARVEYGGRVRVGMDDFALRLLGPQDTIELPGLGETVTQGRPQATIGRDGHVAQPLSPLDGKVLAVNAKLGTRADTANHSPYAEGWFMVVQPTSLRRSLKNLLFGAESLAWMDDEAARLTAVLNETAGYRLAATGGEAVSDIFGSVPNADWDRLVVEFLN
ncbi:MAG: glycine cleavage system protein H [Desulfobacteraceae bacterium]|nr:MAG: glycine cleavage system protein H [Desulfobacteraceae bacterium]